MRSLGTVLFLLLTLQGAAESPRRYIVELAPNARMRGDAEPRGERRFRVRREFSRVLNGAAIELAEGASIDDIARLPYVTRVTPDAIVTAYGQPADLARSMTMRVRTHGGEGVVVAVIDTGVDRFHPALAGKVIGGYDFVNDDDDPMDDHRHGTHVAGIIAASSPAMTGVAPGVSLLAYKVLDHTGNGEMSAIVAGIDRAVADGADVINLSLGTGGHPDDPMARAVDAATAAGVIVVVAAGNAGEFHTIGSPGVAATAITVGAWESATTIADFSSRGPANRSGAIKPELLAPGVSILSTVLNGEFGHSSGTSMAAPYVAGVAALLRAEHAEWTPARVKAALVSTALPIATEEVMSQGTGRIDADRAFASVITVAPVQINFGLDGDIAPLWSSTRTLALRNDGGETRTIRLRNESALTIRMTPEEVTLAPGESRDVEVAIDIDHRLIGKPQTRSFSFGGWIVLEWDGGDARVPWAFVRAARAVVTYPDVRPLVLWNTGERYASLALEANGVEALLEPSVYDMVALTERESDVRIFVSEEQAITGEVVFALSAADAKHAVRLDGVDSRGLPLEAPAVRARFVLPGTSVVLPSFGRTLHTSSFSPKYALLATESAFEAGTTTMHVVQHAPVRGIDADVTLRNQPSEFLGDEVRLQFSSAVPRSIRVMPRDWPRRPGDFGPVPQWFTTTSNGSVWTMRVLMTPEHAGDHVSGVQIAA
ncbi:MAG: S8 family peptidase, partial [Thermoanaerobaculia bacterium]